MLEPKPNEAFEPSKNLKRFWLYTRKSSFFVEGIELPGLFTTFNFERDSVAAAAVLLLEGWGLYSLVSAVGVFEPAAFGGAVAFFLGDIVLAVVRHLPVAAECRAKNSKILASSIEEEYNIERKGKKWKWLSAVAAILILALAAFKIWAYYELTPGAGITGQTISVFLSYLIAASLHITCTGYWLSGACFSLWLGHEWKIWANDKDKKGKGNAYHIHGPRSGVFHIQNGALKIIEAGRDKHKIRKIEQNGEADFELLTYGVLTDAQVQSLVDSQPDEYAKSKVAKVCLKAQLKILDAEPIRPSEVTQNVAGQTI